MLFLWSFAIGLILPPAFSATPSFTGLMLFIALGIYGRKPISFAMAWLAFGFTLNSFVLLQLCQAQLAPSFEGQRFKATFKVVSIPQIKQQNTSFLAAIESIDCTQKCPNLTGGNLRLTWYHPKQSLHAGQVWRAQIQLKRPRGTVNPGGFDAQAWLLNQNIIATGHITKTAQLLAAPSSWQAHREGVQKTLSDIHPTSIYMRFWIALLLGEQGAITPQDWSILQITGTLHLLVISGSHITLVAFWGYWLGLLAAKIISCFNPHSNRLWCHWLPIVSALIWAIYYAALAGFSIPVIRAIIACNLVMLCRASGAQISPFSLLAIALIGVALWEPLAWTNAGFWLSFLAVGLLFLAFAGRPKITLTQAAWQSQWVITLGLLLPLLALGQGIGLTSPIANIVAGPVVSLILVPLLFLAILMAPFYATGAQFIMQLMDTLFGWLWQGLTYLAELPVPLWWPDHVLSPWAIGFSILGTLLLLAPKGLGVRLIGLFWILLAFNVKANAPYELKVTVLDVGQGTSVLIQTPQQHWLYDTGPKSSESFDAGSRMVAPYLRSQGVHDLNVMISHSDNDHAGGAEAIFKAFNVGQFYTGQTLPALHRPSVNCQQGQSWQQDKVTWQVLWPPAPSDPRRLKIKDDNNWSCVVLLSLKQPHKTLHLLLTGDADRWVEQQILKQLPTPVDWVLAGHHGSKTSSDGLFVKRVQAKQVVFSAGYNSRYGHPHQRVVRRWRKSGATPYNTATDGAIIFSWDKNGELDVRKTRETHKKRWF